MSRACSLKALVDYTASFKQNKEAGAAGYILLWLLGIPIPILRIIFLLRGLHVAAVAMFVL
jgi:hypothetical protein